MRIEANQSLLVAKNHCHDTCVIAVRGGIAEWYFNELFWTELEDLGFPESDPPGSPGVYIWEGTCTLHRDDDNPDDDDPWIAEWVGRWRPATTADFAKFGMPLSEAPTHA